MTSRWDILTTVYKKKIQKKKNLIKVIRLRVLAMEMKVSLKVLIRTVIWTNNT